MKSVVYFVFIGICFGTVIADGYGGGLDLKTLVYKLPNRTALCEVLNGTCVAPGDCAVFPNYGHGGGGGGYGHGNQGFQRFDCNLTTICCFSIHRFLHLSGHSGGGYGGHSGGHAGGGGGGSRGGGGGHGGGGYGKKKQELTFKSVVHKVFNRTALCEVLNGTCVSPGDCAVFGYGYGQSSARFDCNLTTICCFSLHQFHHGGFVNFGGHSGGYGGQSNGYGGHSNGYGGHSNGYGGQSNGYGDHDKGYGGHGGNNNGYGGNRRGGRRNRGYSRSSGDYDYGSYGSYGYSPRRRGMRVSGYDYYDDHGSSYDYYGDGH